MPFINEYVPKEDIYKYNIKEEWDEYRPFHPYNIDNPFSPMAWTVDREREVFIIRARTGREEFSNQVEWILWWQGEYLVVVLNAVGGSGSVAADKGHRVWELAEIRKPIGSTANDADIIPVLKEALTVYGYDGIEYQLSDYHVQFTF